MAADGAIARNPACVACKSVGTSAAVPFTDTAKPHQPRGVRTCPGTLTCGGYPGSKGYEKQDAQTFAEWGAPVVFLVICCAACLCVDMCVFVCVLQDKQVVSGTSALYCLSISSKRSLNASSVQKRTSHTYTQTYTHRETHTTQDRHTRTYIHSYTHAHTHTHTHEHTYQH